HARARTRPCTLALHDALPISLRADRAGDVVVIIAEIAPDRVACVAQRLVAGLAREVRHGGELINHADRVADGIGLFADRFAGLQDRKSTRLNSSHVKISYAVF